MSRKGGAQWEEEDYYDGYDDDYDEYYDDDYDDYDDHVSAKKKPAAPSQAPPKTKTKAAAGGTPKKQQQVTKVAKTKAAQQQATVVKRKAGAPATQHGAATSKPAAANDPRSELSSILRDLEVEPQGKPSLLLVVLGHVDAGKSTLMGRLVAELGVVDSKEVRRRAHQATQIGKGSFGWAWLMDERPEERERGVTIDIAKRTFETEARQVTILDAPGHRDFVTNAISGISQADAALLVVDGSSGGFESGFDVRGKISGQTREHAQLAKGIGIDQLAVVVTKLDKHAAGAERLAEIRGKLDPFLKSCGFKDGRIRWLCASGTTGDNVVAKPPGGSALSWFEGPTVVEAIDAFEMVEHKRDAPLRVPVFSSAGAKQGGGAGQVIVTGRLATGCVRVGSQVSVMPGSLDTTVKSISRNGHKDAGFALAGDAVELTLGLDEEASCVSVGSVVCGPSDGIRAVERIKAKIATLELETPFTLGQSLVVHIHAARAPAKVTKLLVLHDPKTGEDVKKRPRLLKSYQTATVEITMSDKVCVEKYEDFASLGRLVLRLGGRTVGVGKVVKVYHT